MEYALQVAGPYEKLLTAAAFAKDRGLVALALPDHYLMALSDEEAATNPAPDAFVQLGGLARETSDIDLVMLVSPITFRHPAVIAKMAVTLDHMSGGRFSLGLGTGWMDREHEVFGFEYPDTGERFARLEEALAYVSAAFDPEAPGFQGDRYQLEAFPLSPAPLGRIPIVVGGTGRYKTPRLAGQYADEFNVYPGPDLAERIKRFRDSAAETGRDAAEIRLSSSGQVFATETEAEFEAIMGEKAADAGISREELDAHYDKRQTPRGTYEQVMETLESFASFGIERFYFQGIFTPSDAGQLLDGLNINGVRWRFGTRPQSQHNPPADDEGGP
jgi:alkanesulfonate monooxygenase SsuD/methylene tetrahydromethanopterin reductase-like flavin-dependent oxidoreductase (luciferase family)